MDKIYDTILLLRSRKTGKVFPIVLFSADTDMVTAGWVSLSSCERNEVVVTEVTATEWSALAQGHAGHRLVEDRVNKLLLRSDLRSPWLIRAEEVGPSLAGLSFQEFRKQYRPPQLVYRDIYDPTSEAEEVSTISRQEFESGGGKVLVVC